MPEEEVVETPKTEEEITAEVPVVEPETEPEPKKVFRKVIQPMAEDGKTPLGQPHVYESDTQEGLDAKMAEAIANGTRKIHELSRKAALETPQIPDGAEVEPIEAPVWTPRDLTEDEKFIVKTDPEKAFDIQYKAKFGRAPNDQLEHEKKVAEDARINRQKAETDMFTDDHPEFYRCDENRDAMFAYMSKVIGHDKSGKPVRLSWTAKNLVKAYKELSESGLLKTKPVEVAPVVLEPNPEARTEPVVPKKTPDFPAVIRNNSSRAVAPIKAKDGKPTAEEIANMSADEYAKNFPELHQAR